MGDENSICTLGDYSKPSHEGYRNTIELPIGNNMVPLQSDTIRLVQNGCSFYGLRSEDPNQHLKDFLKLLDSLDLDGENKERTRLQDLTLYDNGIWNDPRDPVKPVKAITLPQDVPSTSDHRLIELENQVQRLMEAYLGSTQPTQETSWPTRALQQSVTTKGKSSERKESKAQLFSPKYLSPASIKELSKNPSAPKRVHFVNSIVILSTDSDTEEEDISLTHTHEHELGYMVRINEEVEDKGKEEDEMEIDVEVEEVIEEKESEFETDEEIEEVFEEEEEDEDDENFNSFPTMKELSHHEWLLKNPRPPWVKEKIRAGSLNNIKISCMIGHFFKRHAYIDLESPINIMSRRQYNQIVTYDLRSRRKPSNPGKISNFVGRVRRLKVFIGSFAYECDFMIMEDTTSIIDRHLGEMVFGRPFIDETGLVYNEGEGTIMFEQDDEKITFKNPHTIEIFKQTKLMGLSTDSIPPSTHEENFGHERMHYY
ncbi:MAK10-like protein [Tanacetum coccineum]